MSRENVEVVDAALEAFHRRDKDRLLALLDPSIEWELAGFLLDQERIRIGPQQVWDFLTFLDHEFEDTRVEHQGYVEVDGQVVVSIQWRGVGKRSGVEGQFAFTSVFTIANGKVLRARNYTTRAEALEAVGLREGDSLSAE